MRRDFLVLSSGMLLLCGVVGCSGGPSLAPVTGVLTYKGKPVNNVILDFFPEGGGRPSWGLSDSQGRFKLEYDMDNKGALIGKHKVFVRIGPGKEDVSGVRALPSPELAEFFEKYSADKSTVVVEITSSTRELTLAWD